MVFKKSKKRPVAVPRRRFDPNDVDDKIVVSRRAARAFLQDTGSGTQLQVFLRKIRRFLEKRSKKFVFAAVRLRFRPFFLPDRRFTDQFTATPRRRLLDERFSKSRRPLPKRRTRI